MRPNSGFMKAAVVAGLILWGACMACCAPIFVDGFEPSINGSDWVKGPWAGAQNHEDLKGDTGHLRTPGINSAREWVNYRVTYNSLHNLGATYNGGVYLKCWMFEDNDISFPGFTSEYQPNAHITLTGNEIVTERFRIGVMGEIGRTTTPFSRHWFENCSLETVADGFVVLNGQFGKPLVPRRQGWRKYTILVNPYTGNAGDVQFFIDDKLVYNGHRTATPFGEGASVDTIILGSQWWSNETYWFDHLDFGTIETPVDCSTIADAKAQSGGTWVQLNDKVVLGRYSKSPFPGMFAIGEADRSSAIWVSSSYQADVPEATHEGEVVSIKGIMYTNAAGMRYLDAIEITGNKSLASQPEVVGTPLKNLADPNIDGMLVKVWGKVTGRGQERDGDWRRYILIADGSDNAPVKCYYDNIISGIDPVPNVQTGDIVSVVGVAQTDVLFDGSPVESSIWIRKAGDLVVVQAAP